MPVQNFHNWGKPPPISTPISLDPPKLGEIWFLPAEGLCTTTGPEAPSTGAYSHPVVILAVDKTTATVAILTTMGGKPMTSAPPCSEYRQDPGQWMAINGAPHIDPSIPTLTLLGTRPKTTFQYVKTGEKWQVDIADLQTWLGSSNATLDDCSIGRVLAKAGVEDKRNPAAHILKKLRSGTTTPTTTPIGPGNMFPFNTGRKSHKKSSSAPF